MVSKRWTSSLSRSRTLWLSSMAKGVWLERERVCCAEGFCFDFNMGAEIKLNLFFPMETFSSGIK